MNPIPLMRIDQIANAALAFQHTVGGDAAAQHILMLLTEAAKANRLACLESTPGYPASKLPESPSYNAALLVYSQQLNCIPNMRGAWDYISELLENCIGSDGHPRIDFGTFHMLHRASKLLAQQLIDGALSVPTTVSS